MILIVPDAHGRDFYLDALEARHWDHIVFLGDYLDPYGYEGITNETAMERFAGIIRFKRENAGRVTLLLGNHDMHYYSAVVRRAALSSRYDYINALDIERVFDDNRSLFSLAWETEAGGRRFLFTHAPVLRAWLDAHHDLVHALNADALNALLGSPEGEKALADVSRMRGGMADAGSPIWADTHEITPDQCTPGIYQVYGHTQQRRYPIITDDFACLDCRCCFTLNDDAHIDAFPD